jgi:sugar phosphate isomerase/epimerase
MKKLPIALQVYSVREEAEKDFENTMRQVKAMGYDGVELAGLYGLAPEEIRRILTELALPAISAHVPYVTLIADIEKTVSDYAAIGCKYIAIPYLTEENRPGAALFDEVIENIRKIGAACSKLGVTLLYHNHDFEFVKMPDGSYGLDYLFQSVSPSLLQTEIDTCWVRVSGVDPADYIAKYTGRAPVVHLKDYVGQKSDNMYELIGLEDEKKAPQAFAFKAVGAGVQNIPSIIKAAEEAGACWLVVEQDAHTENSAMKDAALSIDYLKSLGL